MRFGLSIYLLLILHHLLKSLYLKLFLIKISLKLIILFLCPLCLNLSLSLGFFDLRYLFEFIKMDLLLLFQLMQFLISFLKLFHFHRFNLKSIYEFMGLVLSLLLSLIDSISATLFTRSSGHVHELANNQMLSLLQSLSF